MTENEELKKALQNRWKEGNAQEIVKRLPELNSEAWIADEVVKLLGESKFEEQWDLRGLEYTGSRFIHFALNDCRLDFSSFTNCVFSNSNLSLARADYCSFVGCNFKGHSTYAQVPPSFAKIHATYCCFDRTTLTSSHFGYSILSNSSFEHALLRNAVFDYSNCSGVSFKGANLEGAKFRGADLSGANFEGAITNGAIFE